MQAFGITGDIHRFWTHRTYKAKWQLKVILLIRCCTAGMVNKRLDNYFLHHEEKVFIHSDSLLK
jgi:fatty-acid desaturase